MVHVDPIGYVGRTLAAIGAFMWISSLFMEVFSGSVTRWDIYRRADVISLILAAAVVLLLILSLFVAKELMLIVVGIIGGYLAGFGVPDLIEVRGLHIAAGGYLGAVGPGLVVVGAVVGLAPTLAAHAGEARDLAFVPSEAASAPAAPPAGWYHDPSGKARFRYWDGRAWTEQTQQ
jgi:Protein of unknown function (DUF2510)